jgi:hypothetical protein
VRVKEMRSGAEAVLKFRAGNCRPERRVKATVSLKVQ